MKQYHVYELFDQTGQIVYVGMSINPKSRFKKHTRCKPIISGTGYFYGREDLDWRVIQTYDSKSEALAAEGARKLELGFEWTERNWNLAGGKVGGKINGRKNVESGHLNAIRVLGNQKNQERIPCEYCGRVTNRLNHGQWHGDRCKFRPIPESL